jgi:dTDP-4-dehydrorhamnose 3,5-epimerase-like enzyme
MKSTGGVTMPISIHHAVIDAQVNGRTVDTIMGRPIDGIEGASLIDFPKVQDYRGNLSIIEAMRNVPFLIRRVYYVYDVPSGVVRGGHAHKSLHQCIIPACGSFTVLLDDGRSTNNVHLDRPDCGLYVPPMVWGDLEGFAPGTLCLVLASEHYDESDYFRNYEEFQQAVRDQSTAANKG